MQLLAHRPDIKRTIARVIIVIVTAGVGLAVASFAMGDRNYGWSLFVGIPYFIGFFSAAILRYRGIATLRACLATAIWTGVALGFGFLLLGKEGLLCLLMTVVLAAPLMLVGAWTAFILLHRGRASGPTGPAILSVILLVLGTWREGRLQRLSPTYTVTDQIVIAAPPDVVWHSLISLSELGRPTDLAFRMGVACPRRVDIYGNGVGALRVCTLTTGTLNERITTWQPSVALAWSSESTPPPLKELNPFRDVDPPHLHGSLSLH